jgi:pimeloyl-ACP methyl ester carboxylesterase
MLNHAKEINDQAVIKKLEKCDPYANDFPQLNYLLKVRTAILNKYGIGHLHQGVTFPEILKSLFVFKGYTVREKMNWLLGADFSMVYLFPPVLKDNLFISSIKFEIPFYITQGVYDYQVSQVLAEKYLNVIKAPKKEFFTFANSAHSPNMEEPEKFIEILRKIALQNPPREE